MITEQQLEESAQKLILAKAKHMLAVDILHSSKTGDELLYNEVAYVKACGELAMAESDNRILQTDYKYQHLFSKQ